MPRNALLNLAFNNKNESKMTQSFTTTLSQEELTSLIQGAVTKAVSLLDSPVSRAAPITRTELMSRLGITEPTVIRWERRGKIPCLRIGSSVRYDWDAVLKSLESKKGKGGKF